MTKIVDFLGREITSKNFLVYVTNTGHRTPSFKIAYVLSTGFKADNYSVSVPQIVCRAYKKTQQGWDKIAREVTLNSPERTLLLYPVDLPDDFIDYVRKQ